MDGILEKYQSRIQAIADHFDISTEQLMINIMEMALSELEDAVREDQILKRAAHSYLDSLHDII